VDEQSIFLQALEIQNLEDRAAWLAETCGDDDDLRKHVEKLISKHEAAGSFLEQPPAEFGATVLTGPEAGDRGAALEAGLAATFDKDEAVVVGKAGHSVLRVLGQTIDMPRVVLRESQVEGDGPIARPKSSEMPERDSDSRYRLDGEIARGGMGAIIKGRDTDLGRDLAIKVLLDSHKDRPEVIQRFVEEAQIGGQLQHPGIAPIYELGQFSDRRPFFAMKLVKGQTLSKLLADREDATVERGKFIGIFEQVCQTMAYARSRGVIHRDLKPANIMVGAFGEVQVMDWGLAKVLSAGGIEDEKQAHSKHKDVSIIQTMRSVGSDTPGAFGSAGSQTQMGSVMGTPAYMPPEQALGEIDNMDERADVFGLGAILCEILTGKPPYVADDGTKVYRMASRGKLDDAFERLENCGADADLIQLTKDCLELEPADRPRNAGVLAERVTGYLESVEEKLRTAEVRGATEAARSHEARKRARVTLALAATVLLAVGLGGGGWLYVQQQAAGHLATVTTNVNDRLGDARLHQQLAAAVDTSSDEGLRNRARELSVALESARDAVNLAAGTQVPAELQNSTSEMLATIEAEYAAADLAANEAAANRELKEKLELIRVSRTAGENVPEEERPNEERHGSRDSESFAMIPLEDDLEEQDYSQLYREAFEDAGFDLLSGDAEAAITRIRQSPIRETLISAIDDWIRIRASEGIPPELVALNWHIPEPSELISAGASLERQPDGSILASKPTGPEDDHYTIVLQPEAGLLSALQLEMLTDDSLPNRGPGHYSSGNFHLQEVKVFLRRGDQPPVPLALANAWASYSWAAYHISRAIDGDLGTAWHVWSQTGRAHQAVFSLGTPTEIEPGDTLLVELHQHQQQHKDGRRIFCPLGRFRLSVTGDIAELTSRRLRHLVDKADYRDWRKQLRAALETGDVQRMQELATDREAKEQQPVLVAWLGRSLRQRSDRDAAVAVLESALQKHPGDLELNLALGQALFEIDKRKQEGLGYLRTALALQPQSPVPRQALGSTYARLGNALFKQKKLDEASAAYHKAIEIDPAQTYEHYRFSVDLYHMGELDDAIAGFRKIIEFNPKDPNGHIGLGIALAGKGMLDDAIAEYRVAMGINPKNAIAHINFGNALCHQGNLDEAIAEYRKAIEINPEEAIAHSNLGVVLRKQGKLDDAIAEFRKAVEIDPKDANAHAEFGHALSKQGKLDEAIAEFRKAIKLNPNDFRPFNAAAWILATDPDEEGRYPDIEQAVTWARRANELSPDNAGYQNTLGTALYRAEQWQAAIDALQKSIDNGSDVPSNWLFLAMAHWQLGQKDEARKWYDKSLAWQTANPDAAKADTELQSFYAEAAALMKPGQQDSTKNPATPDKPATPPAAESSKRSSDEPEDGNTK
jgi:tetratricopeptide (TPR) repeat protein/tRNA A-37 threonylcarbamoyl transferase component Bud32